MSDGLRLEVTEYTDLTRWRWVLTDAGGAFLADHEVRLDPASQEYETFTTLHDWIEWHAAPDKRSAEEARIVATIGDWIGAEVFGPMISAALLQKRPATVEVILPEGADKIAYLPLEAARVESRSLAAHDLTLVIRPHSAESAPAKTPATDKLRVLGLFSLPEGGTALNLRRERQSLVKLFDTIAANGRAAEVKAVQYGVTRDRLRDILEDGDGWDIIHISGHGSPGQLTLETAAGAPDHIDAEALADLLDLARDRVKLVTVSACWSAAQATAEPRHQLGLEPQDSSERISVPPPPQSPPPGDIATTLSTRLGCAVLAMRFPVADEFSIELAGHLYDLLARQGHPLPRAVSLSLRHLTEGDLGRRWPALSMAAPAIFGATASALTLKAPPRTAPASYATEHLKLARFPPQPERFVGRTAVMTRASAVLAPDSGIPGIVLHGMPGGGKTACALELAYTHEDAFEKLIWFKAPDEGAVIDASLTDFALTLERDLPGLQMIDKVVSEPALTAFLPQLTGLMERNRLLIVIDNAESLLTESGQWRDGRWGQLIAALTNHTEIGRLLLTTRRVPTATVDALTREFVDALTFDEGILLALELPGLRTLMSGPRFDRRLAAAAIRTACGHPKLLELAEGQAADLEHIAALPAAGEAPSTAEDYWHVLSTWTNAVTDTLQPGECDLFWFLCCLEEPDRLQPILSTIWPHLWQRLNRGSHPPALDKSLNSISTIGLITIREETEIDDELYSIHPSIAAAGRELAEAGFQNSVDTESARYWEASYHISTGEAKGGMINTGLLVRSGLASAPYLTRLQRWENATALIRNAFVLNPTRANAATLMPAVQFIVSRDNRQVPALTTVLEALNPKAAEEQLRDFICGAVNSEDYRIAALAAGDLTRLCMTSGQLNEALTFAEREGDYIRKSGLGPWTQLLSESHRLLVLNELGYAQQVLNTVQRLRPHMDTLPSTPKNDEAAFPWSVREGLLGVGRDAASQLGQWQIALDFNYAQTASMSHRRAPAVIIAGSRYNDYGPLLKLGRTEDAFSLLRDCLRVFREANDVEALGNTISALADIESHRSHGESAIRLEKDALRYKYLDGNPTAIAGSYHNLGNHLRSFADQPNCALACYLVSALIFTLAATGTKDVPFHEVVALLRSDSTAEQKTTCVACLHREVGKIPGTDPAGLIAKLAPDPETAERTLRDVVAQAQELARQPEPKA